MKKSVLVGFLLILLILISFVIAAEADDGTEISVGDEATEQQKVDLAYDCLEKHMEDCSTSLEENIFTLLATGNCKSEVLNEEKGFCWPKSGCSVKTTAQAIWALNRIGSSTSNEEKWLISQNTTTSELIWYLQIESSKPTNCEITYSSSTHKIFIGEDRKISSGAGSCLPLSEGGYTLLISPNCYDEQFTISCDESFLTNLMFKKTDSSTIHISENTHSASAEGTTSETVNSLCFEKDNECDYESSLWATFALNQLDYDISSFLPYLLAMEDENFEYLPESFLYLVTGESDFRTELFLKQKSNQYWDESGDKFYDTALALYPFRYEDYTEKSNAIKWLLEIQDRNGCWDNGNIRNTAFLLNAIWPKKAEVPPDKNDCENAGYYCMSSLSCSEADGTALDYECSGVFVCCDKQKILKDCAEQNGQICNSNENCVGGNVVDANDTSYGQTCCVRGTCKEPIVEKSECEKNQGICRSYECNDDEEEKTYNCESPSQRCCVKKTGWGGWWILIIILSVSIVIVVLGIIFKNNLRSYLAGIKFKGKPKGPSPPFSPGPGFPSQPPGQIPRRLPRKIFPLQRQTQPIRKITPKSSKEFEDVLKKLKEIGK